MSPGAESQRRSFSARAGAGWLAVQCTLSATHEVGRAGEAWELKN